MSATALANRLADYACKLSFSDLPAPVVHETKRRFIDSIATSTGRDYRRPITYTQPIRNVDRILRSICFGILLLLAAASAAVAQPKPMVLTAEILSQRYCSAGGDALSLELSVRLRYTNVGKEKLILYKGHDLFYQTKVRSVPAAMRISGHDATLSSPPFPAPPGVRPRCSGSCRIPFPPRPI